MLPKKGIVFPNAANLGPHPLAIAYFPSESGPVRANEPVGRPWKRFEAAQRWCKWCRVGAIIGLAATYAHHLIRKGKDRDVGMASNVKLLDKKTTTVVHTTPQAIR
jgi:hypothetical protein